MTAVMLAAVALWACQSESPQHAAGFDGGTGGAPANAVDAASSVDPMVATESAGTLADTEFVYQKSVMRKDGSGKYTHLYAFDLDTQKERLVSDLEESAGWSNYFSGCAVAPDRRSIAFAAAEFRRNGASDGGAVWRVGMDGKTFVRLSDDLSKERLRYSQDGTATDLVWSAAGTEIFFSTTTFAMYIPGASAVIDSNPRRLLLSAAEGGHLREAIGASPCHANFPVSANRNGGLLVVQDRCYHYDASDPKFYGIPDQAQVGLWEYSTNPLVPKRRLTFKSDQPGEDWFPLENTAHAWSLDGSAIFATVTPTQGYKTRVVLGSSDSDSAKTIYTPEKPNQMVVYLQVGRRGDLLLKLWEQAGKAENLYTLVRLEPETWKPTVVLPASPTDFRLCY